ncbi:MAG: DNA recombination protein RmuC [Muribaculaceae bacterium]
MDIALISIIAALSVAALTIYALRQAKAANSATMQAENLKARNAELTEQLAQCNAQLDAANRQTLSLTSDLASANSRCSSLNDTIGQLRADLADTKADLDCKIKQFNEVAAENGALRERAEAIAKETQRLRDEAEQRFNTLAQKVLEEKSNSFKKANEQRLDEILKPLRDNIESFKKDINDKYLNESKDRNALQEHIRQLMELNRTISNDAQQLTNALRGNSKIQGDWGEMILESILEKSGLIEGDNFKVQVTRDSDGNIIRNDEGGQLRPDVIVYMPDGRCIVIDSKTSLTNYVNHVNADNIDQQKNYLNLHIASVKAHIDELKGKRYDEYVKQSGNFVMMFIPNEGAYTAAMQADPSLWQYAYDRKVVIVSPTHLIATLRLINQLWMHDKQTKNAIDIAVESGKLYDKFVGLYEDMLKIGSSLDTTQKAYASALGKVKDGRGSLISHVEKLKTMGAKASKALPMPDDTDPDDPQPAVPAKKKK